MEIKKHSVIAIVLVVLAVLAFTISPVEAFADESDKPLYTQSALENTEESQEVEINLVDKYLAFAKAIADDNKIGYSQENRYLNSGVDCSSFIYYSLINSGVCNTSELGSSPFTTYSMGNLLIEAGFSQYRYSDVLNELMPGDILVKTDHTEMVYDPETKSTIGAHRDYDGVSGDSTGKEVSISKGNALDSSWIYVYRLDDEHRIHCIKNLEKLVEGNKTQTTQRKRQAEETEVASVNEVINLESEKPARAGEKGKTSEELSLDKTSTTPVEDSDKSNNNPTTSKEVLVTPKTELELSVPTTQQEVVETVQSKEV